MVFPSKSVSVLMVLMCSVAICELVDDCGAAQESYKSGQWKRNAIGELATVFAQKLSEIYKSANSAEYDEQFVIANMTDLSVDDCNRYKILRKMEDRLHDMTKAIVSEYIADMRSIYSGLLADQNLNVVGPCEKYSAVAEAEKKLVVKVEKRTGELFDDFLEISNDIKLRKDELLKEEAETDTRDDQLSCRIHYVAYAMATKFREKVEREIRVLLALVQDVYKQ